MKPKTADQLASELGVSSHTIWKKRRQGKDDPTIIREAAEHKAKRPKAEAKEGVESFYEAQRRKEVALAGLRELELSAQRGELVNLAEINAYVSGMIVRARDLLLRIGPELADRIAAESSPVKIQQMIDDEVSRALSQLAQYKGEAKAK